MLTFLMQGSAIYAQQPDYYREITLENYRQQKAFNETIDFNSPDLIRLNAVLFFATNEVRVKQKLPVLEHSYRLEEAAAMHSCDMITQDFFSHFNPANRKKKTPNDRAGLAGILNPYVAENIAEEFGLEYKSGSNVYEMGEGQFSYLPEGKLIPARTYLSLAESLIDRWMHSPEHKKNILSPDALELGCGTCFFTDVKFNDMPTFMATQNFQWYEKTRLQQQ